DVSPQLLDAGFVALLEKGVREKGLGLFVQAGPLYMPHRPPKALQELLPGRGQKGVAGRYPPRSAAFGGGRAPEGSRNGAMRLYDEPGRNQSAWANLPRYYWCAAAERPAPGATVLAYNPIATGYGKLPLIAHHYAGQGRVLFVGTDETFRWRQNVGERFFYRFWGQATRFLARRDSAGGKKGWIEVRAHRAQPGEVAEVELTARDAGGKALLEPKLFVDVVGAGKKTQVDVTPDPLVPGRYTGRFTPAAAGEHTVSWTPPDGKEPIEA